MFGVRNTKKLDVKSIVMERLGRNFHNVKIVDVLVHADLDEDGDRVLVIDIVIEGMPEKQDKLAMSGAVRHIRPELVSAGEDAFPLISFISESDARAARLGTT
jgi:hypothetical protein